MSEKWVCPFCHGTIEDESLDNLRMSAKNHLIVHGRESRFTGVFWKHPNVWELGRREIVPEFVDGTYRLGSLFLSLSENDELDGEMGELFERLQNSDSRKSLSVRIWDSLEDMRDEKEGLKFDEIDQFDQFFYLDHLESRLGDAHR